MNINRKESKKSNIYKVVIFDRHHSDIAYLTSLIKVEKYIEEWAKNVFTKEIYEIIMSRLNIQDDEKKWGILIDEGAINLIDSNISFDIKVYRLKIL